MGTKIPDGERGGYNTTQYTVSTRMILDFCRIILVVNFQMGSNDSFLCFINCEGQNHKDTVDKPQLLKREDKAEQRSSCLPTQQLTTKPNWPTDTDCKH